MKMATGEMISQSSLRPRVINLWQRSEILFFLIGGWCGWFGKEQIVYISKDWRHSVQLFVVLFVCNPFENFNYNSISPPSPLPAKLASRINSRLHHCIHGFHSSAPNAFNLQLNKQKMYMSLALLLRQSILTIILDPN